MAKTNSSKKKKGLNSKQYMKEFMKEVRGKFLYTNIITNTDKDYPSLKGRVLNLTKIESMYPFRFNDDNIASKRFPFWYLGVYIGQKHYLLHYPIGNYKNTCERILDKVMDFLNSFYTTLNELHDLIKYQPFGLLEQQMKIAFEYDNCLHEEQEEQEKLIELKKDEVAVETKN